MTRKGKGKARKESQRSAGQFDTKTQINNSTTRVSNAILKEEKQKIFEKLIKNVKFERNE